MSFIFTKPTDQQDVECGYCSHCLNYVEVWKKDKTSECPYCKKKLIHISAWKTLTVLYLFMFVLIILLALKQ